MLKIISGAQTGVDQAALRAAWALDIPTGGTMPLGFLTEDGNRPEFAGLYGMEESDSLNYPIRTRQNVEDADVTLWYGPVGSRGYWATMRAVNDAGKPLHVLSMVCREAIKDTAQYLAEFAIVHGNVTINVAGSRESGNPGIGEVAERDLTMLFQELLDAIGSAG